jgi:hypothetical protein
LIYEARAGAYLENRFAEAFRRGPWVIFADDSGRERWCQPDGFIADPIATRIIVTEIKLRHCSEAYYQLFDLYLPVVRSLYPGWRVAGLEVCRWFDPATATPAPVRLRENPFDAVDGAFNVHIWSP